MTSPAITIPQPTLLLYENAPMFTDSLLALMTMLGGATVSRSRLVYVGHSVCWHPFDAYTEYTVHAAYRYLQAEADDEQAVPEPIDGLTLFVDIRFDTTEHSDVATVVTVQYGDDVILLQFEAAKLMELLSMEQLLYLVALTKDLACALSQRLLARVFPAHTE